MLLPRLAGIAEKGWSDSAGVVMGRPPRAPGGTRPTLEPRRPDLLQVFHCRLGTGALSVNSYPVQKNFEIRPQAPLGILRDPIRGSGSLLRVGRRDQGERHLISILLRDAASSRRCMFIYMLVSVAFSSIRSGLCRRSTFPIAATIRTTVCRLRRRSIH